jgi:hypothetical protein
MKIELGPAKKFPRPDPISKNYFNLFHCGKTVEEYKTQQRWYAN